MKYSQTAMLEGTVMFALSLFKASAVPEGKIENTKGGNKI